MCFVSCARLCVVWLARLVLFGVLGVGCFVGLSLIGECLFRWLARCCLCCVCLVWC